MLLQLVRGEEMTSTTAAAVAVTQTSKFWGHGRAAGRGSAAMAQTMAAPATTATTVAVTQSSRFWGTAT